MNSFHLYHFCNIYICVSLWHKPHHQCRNYEEIPVFHLSLHHRGSICHIMRLLRAGKDIRQPIFFELDQRHNFRPLRCHRRSSRPHPRCLPLQKTQPNQTRIGKKFKHEHQKIRRSIHLLRPNPFTLANFAVGRVRPTRF